MPSQEICWNEETYKQLITHLIKNQADEKYKAYQKLVIGPDKNLMGIKYVHIREAAKKIAKENWEEFLEFRPEKTYLEETLLRGLVICFAKTSYETRVKYILDYMPEVNSWFTCDHFISNLKFIKEDTERFYDIIKMWLKFKNIWYLRAAYLALSDYYVSEKYFDDLKDICREAKHSNEVVWSAAASLLTSMFLKFRDETYLFILNDRPFLNKFVFKRLGYNIISSAQTSLADKKAMKMFIGYKPEIKTSPRVKF